MPEDIFKSKGLSCLQSGRIPAREVRFAVTMVGGTSLAIYESGAATELHSLVFGKGVYGLLKRITHSHAYVDVLTGTSAGGINAICLATAIANGATFNQVAPIWISLANMDAVLSSPEGNTAKSLFQGTNYTLPKLQELFSTLAGPGCRKEPKGASTLPSSFPGDSINGYGLDLLITGTYFEGQSKTYYDQFGSAVYTEDYHGVFRLRHAPREKTSHFNHKLAEPGDPTWRNASNHQEKIVHRLARIARTTSSLPAIFEPSEVTEAEVGKVIPLSRTDRPTIMFDGGFLNNRPLGLALETIRGRTSYTEVVRKTLFVEPVAVSRTTWEKTLAEVNPLQAVLFAKDVGSRESIFASFRHLEELNQRTRQFQELQRTLRTQMPSIETLRKQTSSWQEQRRSDLRDVLIGLWREKLGLRSVDGVESSDGFGSRAEDEANQKRQREQARKLEIISQDLVDHVLTGGDLRLFDTLTLIRLINRVREEVRELRFPSDPKILNNVAIPSALKTLGYADTADSDWHKIEEKVKQLNALRGSVEALQEKIKQIIQSYDIATWLEKEKGASALWNEEKGLREQLRIHVGDELETLRATFQDLAHDLFTLLKPTLSPRGLEYSWLSQAISTPENLIRVIEALDIYFWPYERVSNLSSWRPIDLVYVSARSCQDGLSERDPQQKLAGDALLNLGGFFKASWRANDILWGRLDTASALVRTLTDLNRIHFLTNEDRRYHQEALVAVDAYLRTGDPLALPEATGDNHFSWLEQQEAYKEWQNQKTTPDWVTSLRAVILLRHQAELVAELVPEVYQVALTEAVEQHEQSLTPPTAPTQFSQKEAQNVFSGAWDTIRQKWGGSQDFAVRQARQQQANTELNRLFSTPAATLEFFASGQYQVGNETLQRDIPQLVTLQRVVQCGLITLQLLGKSGLPTGLDTLILRPLRSLLWVLYLLFEGLRQGKTARVAVLAIVSALLVVLPVLLFLLPVLKVDDKEQSLRNLLIGSWFLVMVFGVAIARFRHGRLDGVAYICLSLGVGGLVYGALTTTALGLIMGSILLAIGTTLRLLRYSRLMATIPGFFLLSLLATLWYGLPQKTTPSVTTTAWWLIGSGSMVILLGFWQAAITKRLGSGAIVGLELAGTPARVAELVNRWGIQGRADIKRTLLPDCLFALAYGIFGAILISQIGDWVPKLRLLAVPISGGVALAAVLDVLENLLLWRTLSHSEMQKGIVHPDALSKEIIKFTRHLASIKFGLVITALFYVIAALLLNQYLK